MLTETAYRVVYYTMQGIRYKDFTDPVKATKFRDRHIAKHPEYQNSAYSKTELVILEPGTPPAPSTDVTITLTKAEFDALIYVLSDTIEVYEDTVKDEDFMEYEDRKALLQTIVDLKSLKEKLPNDKDL